MIGSHLLAELVKAGHKCRSIKRDKSDLSVIKRHFQRSFGRLREFDQIEWINADLLDIESMREAVKGVETIFHCAAMVSFFSNDSEKMKRINIHGTRYLCNLALEYGVTKFVFVSSTAAIGNQAHSEPISELDKWTKDAGNSNYGLSKHLAELEVWRASEEGLKIAIVNPSIVIGPGNWNSSSPLIFSRINNGLKFYTPGSNAFVDVRDVVNIMIKLAFSDVTNERYLICAENMHFQDLFKQIASELNKPFPKIAAKRWMANLAMVAENIRSFFAGNTPFITRETAQNGFREIKFSNEKVKKDLNYEFIPISEAVQYTAEIFKKEHS